MLVALMKLKLGLLNKDLAVRFDISTSRMSKIIRSLVPLIAAHMTNLIVWPDHGTIRRHLPRSFKKNSKYCVCIIDCSEIFIERTENLKVRAQTWLNYKHNNTLKYLIGITPAGAISFLSLDGVVECRINKLQKNQVFSIKFPWVIVYWQIEVLI